MSALAVPAFAWVRRGEAALLGGVAAALAMGIPTDVIANPWFTRMTPVRPLDVGLLVVTSLLLAACAATYVGGPPSRAGGRVLGGGTFTALAIGCPVCNKLIVALLGASGATTWFSPVQPVLGAVGAGLALWALRVRLKARDACGAPNCP